MRDFLVTQGVNESYIVLEERTQNTYENALESSSLLKECGIHRIIFVTDASHMRRASTCFRKQRLEVTPAPGGRIGSDHHLDWVDAFPDANSATQMETAWHEWIGLACYRVLGRV